MGPWFFSQRFADIFDAREAPAISIPPTACNDSPVTFEDFDAQLPKGVQGAMIRSETDGKWLVKFWSRGPRVDRDDFLFVVRAPSKKTTPGQLYELALPVVLAYVAAIQKLESL